MSARLEPHKAQTVLYRAIGRIAEYAAIITDVREDGCSLTVFEPGKSELMPLTRIKYFDRKASVLQDHKGPACYPPV